MEALGAIPMVNALIEQERYGEALKLIDSASEIMGEVIGDVFPEGYTYSKEESLVLAKFFLMKKEYRRCVKYALQAEELIDTLQERYLEPLRFRMLDQYLMERSGKTEPMGGMSDKLRNKVIGMVREDKNDPSYIGFLAEAREYDLVKEVIREELFCYGPDNEEIVNTVLDMAYEDISDVLLDVGDAYGKRGEVCEGINEGLVRLIVEAYCYKEKIDQLKAFLMILPWDRLYSACFFIEDSFKVDLTLPNENANFILSGDWKSEILSDFLFKNSKTSFKLIEAMGKARAPFISFCNSIMNAGTTNDTLYRNNKGFLSGREWTRFLDLSSLGMIHQGNVNAFEILKEVLPSLESSSGEPAALMALGLMNIGKCEKETTDYLLNWLDSQDPELVFGSSMGIGFNMLESGEYTIFDRFKSLFSIDSTVIQESAAYGIGMIYAGSGNKEAVRFLRLISESTDFTRVKRAAGLSMALVNTMCLCPVPSCLCPVRSSSLSSNDAYVRYGAVLSLGASHVTSCDLKIVRTLLPFVNDSDDDVKRAAVIAIALVAQDDFEIYEACLLPLAQHHSMHVRATVALVLGMFNSGSPYPEITAVLEALLYDSELLVRQGAAIGSGFILVQMNPTLVSNYKRIIDRLSYFIAMKGEPQCVRIGAAIGRALAEAGGRSMVFSFRNLSKQVEVKRVVGALLFLHSWYWYPLMPAVSMMMLPTPIFFFDENLDATKHVLSNDAKFYDYVVRLPELKKSRRGRHSRENDKDTLYEAPQGLRSGDRLTYFERMEYNLESVVLFRKDSK